MDQAVDDSNQAAIGQGDSVPRTVLVVDDDPAIRSTVVDALRDWGYVAREASSITAALTLITREQPAAVLLDLKISDGAGISILKELRRRSPDSVIVFIAGYGNPKNALEAGLRRAYGFLTKPFDETEMRSMLEEALRPQTTSSRKENILTYDDSRQQYFNQTKRGRPQQTTTAPLGKLILKAMKSLGLSYKHVVAESERLAKLHKNSDMRIGKSTLGNIISGSIRQPGTAKLDALRIILNLSHAETDAALGLQPERHFPEQLELSRGRTHEVNAETVTRHRKIRFPILRNDTDLNDSQLLEGAVKRWSTIEVEYLSSFFPLHYCYVVVGEHDNNAAPIAPPGSRLLVNKLLNKIRSSEGVNYHERELYYVLTPRGHTCAYLETAPGDRIVLSPHPLSGNVREEFRSSEIRVIGQVVGVLYPR
jgi:DNA-binding response OmpR family regulator